MNTNGHTDSGEPIHEGTRWSLRFTDLRFWGVKHPYHQLDTLGVNGIHVISRCSKLIDNHGVGLCRGDMCVAAMAEAQRGTPVILMVRPVRAPIFSMQGNGYFEIVLMGMAGLVCAGHKGKQDEIEGQHASEKTHGGKSK